MHTHLHIEPRFKGDGQRVGFMHSDPGQLSRERLSLYKSYIQKSYSFSGYGKLNISEGRYFVFDKNSMSITKCLDVRKIPPFFALDATCEDFDSALRKCVFDVQF